VFAEVGRLTDGATPLADALSDRRVLLRRLTDHLDVLMGTLGDRGTQLADAVALGSRTLEVTDRRGPQIEEGLRQLAPALDEAEQALAATQRLSEPLAPALDRLLPAAANAREVASTFRGTLPSLDRFVGAAANVARDGRKPARLFAKGLAGQSELIANDQTPALKELIGLVNLLERNRKGVIQFARNMSGVTSVNRRAGTYGQFHITQFETSPQAFGFPSSATRSRNGRPSLLARSLAETLDRTCRDSNPAACLIRFQTPGLSDTPALSKGRGR
jgi:ABC-type transporter Mla subunit MlaD